MRADWCSILTAPMSPCCIRCVVAALHRLPVAGLCEVWCRRHHQHGSNHAGRVTLRSPAASLGANTKEPCGIRLSCVEMTRTWTGTQPTLRDKCSAALFWCVRNLQHTTSCCCCCCCCCCCSASLCHVALFGPSSEA